MDKKVFDQRRIIKTAKWAVRIAFAALMALIIGALPVYINNEMKDIRKMKRELAAMKKLNSRLFADLEESAVKLDSLKTKAGLERIIREKGFAPKDALVYQFE
ncbi:hypothetical protein KKF34_08930 [Myxococcota bacterium]|nr:hypothetical protein [Myxococcota bacterium]MBU1380643.1 hypothetical protein [Myxococcota bacterium]MBU1496985.1 hypothetical protein [Myxococcota bacterium]